MVLVENAGELVEKQDLMQRVWSESFVEEANIQVQISAIRKVLGRNNLIETVPKRGYRFKATVKRIGLGVNGFQRSSLERTTSSAQNQQENRSRQISRSPLPSMQYLSLAVILMVVLSISLTIFNRSKSTDSENLRKISFSKLTDSGKVPNGVISPDGTNLIYQLLEAGKSSLWLRNLPSGAEKQIVDAGFRAFENLVFSRDGKAVYFTDYENKLDSLYRVPILSGNPKKLLDDIYGRITFSPDGERFAFVRINEKTAEYSLITARNDGNDEKIISVSDVEKGQFCRPAWSPDGTTIAMWKRKLGLGRTWKPMELG